MSSNVQKSRPSWVLPVIGFLIGMLIGWWVIGWGIWPVQWTNALPPDLRAAERDEYLTMVAESYAASRNADVAKGRLATWSPQALSQDLSNLQTRVASNPQLAAQVLALSQLVGAGSSTAPGAQAPGKAAPPAARPGTAPSCSDRGGYGRDAAHCRHGLAVAAPARGSDRGGRLLLAPLARCACRTVRSCDRCLDASGAFCPARAAIVQRCQRRGRTVDKQLPSSNGSGR